MSCNNCCNNSKSGAKLPIGLDFTNLDFFIIYNPTTGRIEKVQKSTTTGLFLIAENNLSDVESVSDSRNNLDVYSKSEVYTQNQVDALIAALPDPLTLQGNWDANTNTPDITTTTETGYFWIVSVAGSTNLGGITDWEVNDWAVKTDTGWAKVDNTQQAPSWGTIIGTLSNQTDLQDELDNKANLTGGNTIADAQTFTGAVTFSSDINAQEGVVSDISVAGTDNWLELIDGSANYTVKSSSGRLIVEQNSTDIFWFRSGGRVGIGKDPDVTLDVLGNSHVSGTGTFGAEGQSNEITILGDTGEDLTITKNLDGTTTLENTGNESFEFQGDIENSNYGMFTDFMRLNPSTFANLPSPASQGMVASITDASAISYRAVASGGGAGAALVFYDGANWIYS